MRSNDRILVLEKQGKETNMGLLDPKILTGKNPLHCFMDVDTGLWKFRYEYGVIPPALRERFTSFKAAKEYADQFFATRNIKIIEVIDDAQPAS